MRRKIRTETLVLVETFLSVLGILNFLSVGTYISCICFTLQPLGASSSLGYLALGFTVAGVLLLIYGIIQTWKGKTSLGGATNLAAGTLLFFFIVYFTFLVQPSVLKWLGILVFSFPLPPLLSGILCLAKPKRKTGE